MYKLTPAVHPQVKEFIDSKTTLNALVAAFGSPLNVIFPEIMGENIALFDHILNKQRFSYKIHYAAKPNKATAFIKQALYSKLRIDVASRGEMVAALSAGFRGDMIEATGPKNEAYILLCLQHGVTLNVDSFDEIESILQLRQKLGLTARVPLLVRLCGFISTTRHLLSQDSRFGIPCQELAGLIHIMKEHQSDIELLGFSYHINNTGIQDRIVASEGLIDCMLACHEQGLQPQIVDIGGGFLTSYLEREDQWTDFKSLIKESVRSGIESYGWNNHRFGLRSENNTVKGALQFYDFYQEITKEQFLALVLEAPLEKYENRTFSQILADNMFELWIEPGRALLDQCGITVASVTFTKRSEQGNTIVGLDMNKTHINTDEFELFTDPIIVHNTPQIKHEKGVYFAGNLCLKSDMITRRKSFLGSLPQKGDLIVFINTAPYNMDFSESSPLRQRIAEKVCVVKGQHDFSFFTDDAYNPYVRKDYDL